MLIRLLLLLFSLPLGATVFQAQPISQQVKEADGVVLGHYLKSKVIQLDDGSVVTQMIFRMSREFGLQSELFGMDEVIVHYPGGKWKDLHVKVEGVPEFTPGEHVAIMIKSREDRYWGLNLGFGTFKIVSYGNETMLVNTIFPSDRRAGQIKLGDFEKLVRNVKGSNLKTVRAPIYPTEVDSSYTERAPSSATEEKIRSIASKTDQVDNEPVGPQFNSMWLLIFLAVIGGLFRIMRQKDV